MILGLFVLLIQSTREVEGVLAGAIVIPHGDFAYDPTLIPTSRTKERLYAEELSVASRVAGNWLFDDVQPDFIFLSTPHGMKLDNDFAIFMGKRGRGTTLIGEDVIPKDNTLLYNLTLEVEFTPTLAKNLLSYLYYDQSHHRNNVSGIFGFDDEWPMPLNWGEIIPLSMIFPSSESDRHSQQNHMKQDSQKETPKRNSLRFRNMNQQRQKPVIIWSNPERRYDHAPDMVSEILSLGRQIQKWIDELPERVGVVISADLSHTHTPDGPYGYSNASDPFDTAIGRWASDPCSVEGSSSLLTTCRNLQNDAKCCGYTGLVLLHGMICPDASASPTKTSKEDSTQFKAILLANRNVTYYGMMAATFARIPRSMPMRNVAHAIG